MAILIRLIRRNSCPSLWIRYAGWIEAQDEMRCDSFPIASMPSWPFYRLLLSWFFVICGVSFFCATTDAATLEEYTVKSALTLNLAIFTEWPKSAFTSIDDDIHLCVIGNNTVQESFMELSGKKIEQRKIIVTDISRSGKIAGCHILFIGGQDRIQLSRMQVAASGKPILTIDDINEPTAYRSVVNLSYHNGKIELNINLKLAQQNQLEISARLLKLAHIVSAEPLTDVP